MNKKKGIALGLFSCALVCGGGILAGCGGGSLYTLDLPDVDPNGNYTIEVSGEESIIDSTTRTYKVNGNDGYRVRITLDAGYDPSLVQVKVNGEVVTCQQSGWELIYSVGSVSDDVVMTIENVVKKQHSVRFGQTAMKENAQDEPITTNDFMLDMRIKYKNSFGVWEEKSFSEVTAEDIELTYEYGMAKFYVKSNVPGAITNANPLCLKSGTFNGVLLKRQNPTMPGVYMYEMEGVPQETITGRASEDGWYEYSANITEDTTIYLNTFDASYNQIGAPLFPADNKTYQVSMSAVTDYRNGFAVSISKLQSDVDFSSLKLTIHDTVIDDIYNIYGSGIGLSGIRRYDFETGIRYDFEGGRFTPEVFIDRTIEREVAPSGYNYVFVINGIDLSANTNVFSIDWNQTGGVLPEIEYPSDASIENQKPYCISDGKLYFEKSLSYINLRTLLLENYDYSQTKVKIYKDGSDIPQIIERQGTIESQYELSYTEDAESSNYYYLKILSAGYASSYRVEFVDIVEKFIQVTIDNPYSDEVQFYRQITEGTVISNENLANNSVIENIEHGHSFVFGINGINEQEYADLSGYYLKIYRANDPTQENIAPWFFTTVRVAEDSGSTTQKSWVWSMSVLDGESFKVSLVKEVYLRSLIIENNPYDEGKLGMTESPDFSSATIKAVYSDGTEKTLTSDEYSVDTTRLPTERTEHMIYEISIQYTDTTLNQTVSLPLVLMVEEKREDPGLALQNVNKTYGDEAPAKTDFYTNTNLIDDTEIVLEFLVDETPDPNTLINEYWTTEFPKNAGTYNVRITFAGNDTYRPYTTERDSLIIARRNIQISVDDKESVYGESLETLTATILDIADNSLVGTDTIADLGLVFDILDNGSVSSPSSVGTYVINLSESRNYLTYPKAYNYDVINTNTGVYEIIKANLSQSVIDSLVIPSTINTTYREDGSLTYELIKDERWNINTTPYIAFVNVNNDLEVNMEMALSVNETGYPIRVKYNPDPGCYNDYIADTITTIWVAPVDISEMGLYQLSSVTHIYNGNAQTCSESYIEGMTHNGLTVSVTYRTTAIGEYNLYELPSFTEVGEYTIYYKVSLNNANYTEFEGSATVTINPQE